MNKLVVIGSNPQVLKEIQDWAEKKQYKMEIYSDKEWNKVEKKIIPIRPYLLPAGVNPSSRAVSLSDIESQAISAVLESTNGNISKVSQILKVGRATLYRKIKEHDINLDKLRSKETNNLAKSRKIG